MRRRNRAASDTHRKGRLAALGLYVTRSALVLTLILLGGWIAWRALG